MLLAQTPRTRMLTLLPSLREASPCLSPEEVRFPVIKLTSVPVDLAVLDGILISTLPLIGVFRSAPTYLRRFLLAATNLTNPTVVLPPPELPPMSRLKLILAAGLAVPLFIRGNLTTFSLLPLMVAFPALLPGSMVEMR